MLPLNDALDRILSGIQPLDSVRVPLRSASGRFSAETVRAPLDLPVFDNSAMDGYAVRSSDMASGAGPFRLRCQSRLTAGAGFVGEVPAGSCVRVFTGAMLPAGTDAVVMQEDTELDPHHPDEVRVLEPVKPWENIRFQGEDVRQGTVVLREGDRITPGGIALLGALGLTEVRVHRPPAAVVVATGNELREGGTPLEPGGIFESNRACLSGWLGEAGVAARIHPIVRDTLEATRSALELAFQEADVVVTCGGVSVGEMDFVKAAFKELGGTQEFWRVAIKPGKPFVFGRLNSKCFFGLPGNPVSAAVTFLLLVRPAILRLQGAIETGLPASRGCLGQRFMNSGDRPHFVRVIQDQAGVVRSAGKQGSHLLVSLAAANGLLEVPPGADWPVGKEVAVLRIA